MHVGRTATVAVTFGVTVATMSTAACSTSRDPGAPSTTASVAAPPPTTVEELCRQQSWPRPLPDVTGRLLHQTINVGALACWTDVRPVAPDGRIAGGGGGYRIAALTPAPGTPAQRGDTVTLHVVEADPTAPPAFYPCDWVTGDEVATALGGPTAATPEGDQLGSVDISCTYSTGAGGNGMTSELRLPDAFPVDAASQFALAATGDATVVDGLGLRARCVYEPTTTPPSTTLLVLLSGARIYRATGWYALSCDQLRAVAQPAIDRIGP